MDVRIKALPNNSVKVIVTVERHFTNVGNAPILHRAMAWIDEWGFSEKSEILRCAISGRNGKRTKEFKARSSIKTTGVC